MSQEKPKVLCIEDNPVNWRLVQRLLAHAGFDTHWAEEGATGFKMALELRPDLILLDINLPGLSGFELASKFRNHPDLVAMKIVALTAKTQKTDRETALVAGCDGFIPKPIDPFTFVNQVWSYLGGRKDEVDQGREQAVLRTLNAHVIEHLETQLREVTAANAKLLEVQGDLEARNRSLARLLALSQIMVSKHDASELLRRVLNEVWETFQVTSIHAYRKHAGGGYWEGFQLKEGRILAAPTLPLDSPLTRRLLALLPMDRPLSGDALKQARAYDEGLSVNLWALKGEPCLVLLPDHQNERDIWGFWTLTRPKDATWSAADLEVLTLHGSIAQTNVENAELFTSLSESTRALAASYERMEAAYQDLQHARDDLMIRDRRVMLEDLFLKIAGRLGQPVTTLRTRIHCLDEHVMACVANGRPVEDQVPMALTEMSEAVFKIDGLLRALMRRAQGADPGVPEWINLREVVIQELELLSAERGLGTDLHLELRLAEGEPTLFGVYGDFARMLQHLVQHVLDSPTPVGPLQVASWVADDQFHLVFTDQAGAIPPTELAQAFAPFSTLHELPVRGVRLPGRDLALLQQTLASYHGQAHIQNEGDGTCVHVTIPLH